MSKEGDRLYSVVLEKCCEALRLEAGNQLPDENEVFAFIAGLEEDLNEIFNPPDVRAERLRKEEEDGLDGQLETGLPETDGFGHPVVEVEHRQIDTSGTGGA